MTPDQFCYWLQGWFELNKTIDHREGATPETLQVIEQHLQLVMDKRTGDALGKALKALDEGRQAGELGPLEEFAQQRLTC